MRPYWQQFLEHTVQQAKQGHLAELRPGLHCAWGNSALPITNGYYLTQPVPDAELLRAHLAAAQADAAQRPPLPWLFYVPSSSVAELGVPAVDAVAADCGLAPFLTMREMTADVSALTPPRRPLPPMDFRRVRSTADASTVLELNLNAYSMPLEILPSCLDSGMFLAGKSPECGMVGYVDGVAVSTASVIVLHNVLYVALVATAPDHRQRGYADAVMRHALQTAATEFDLHHAALDASVMGEPIYAAMGFSPTGTDWRVLMAAHHD